jgi:hypothetical protein
MLCIGEHSCFDLGHPWQATGLLTLNVNSCAAKSKSSKALRDDRALYEQLSMASVFTTSQITTSLVYPRATGPLSIPSARSFVHHSVTHGNLQIYVPADASQRKACYRSQLPKLLATILDVDASGIFDVSRTLSADLRDMDEIMVEQDIKHVGWIAKPTLQIPHTDEEEPWVSAHASHAASSFDRVSTFDGNDTATLAYPLPGSSNPGTTLACYGRTIPEETFETISPSQYPELIEMVVRSAQRAGARYLGDEDEDEDEDEEDEDYQYFDYVRKFGSHEQIAWRRIGAAGEAYVSYPPLHLVHY